MTHTCKLCILALTIFMSTFSIRAQQPSAFKVAAIDAYAATYAAHLNRTKASIAHANELAVRSDALATSAPQHSIANRLRIVIGNINLIEMKLEIAELGFSAPPNEEELSALSRNITEELTKVKADIDKLE